MIIEFFGLSNSGKSVLKRKLESQGYSVSKPEKLGEVRKTALFFLYLIKNPIKTMKLFWMLNTNNADVNNLSTGKRMKIRIMRNSYLAGVLAKYELLRNRKEDIFTDEFSLQSLFMIFQKKADEKSIRKAMEILPKSKILFLFEVSRKERYNAYKKPHPYKKGASHFPGSWIDHEYARKFMDSMEHNYKIIKRIIFEKYRGDKKKFKEIKFAPKKTFVRKNE
ncbi:MAG: hypothetical protein AABW80_04295 [Nanoarchaeota archaeon]